MDRADVANGVKSPKTASASEVESSKIASASEVEESDDLYIISDADPDPKVCMCVSCISVKCYPLVDVDYVCTVFCFQYLSLCITTMWRVGEEGGGL